MARVQDLLTADPKAALRLSEQLMLLATDSKDQLMKALALRTKSPIYVDSQVIDTGGEDFHLIALVEYPSRQAFVAIATDPHVREIGVHRAAGLESQWLIATTTENR